MNDKNFLMIILISVTAWFLSHILLLSPYGKDIEKLKKSIKNLSGNISGLYKKNDSVSQKLIAKLEKQNKILKKKLNKFRKEISFKGINYNIDSLVEFKSQYNHKLGNLIYKANKVGTSFDKTLGFVKNLPSSINTKYWLSLELTYQIINHLLNLGSLKNSIDLITGINHPDLYSKNEWNKKNFINTFSIEISFKSSFKLLLKTIHSLTRFEKFNKTPFPFIIIKNATISKSKKKNVIQSDLTLMFLQINLQGKLRNKKIIKQPTTNIQSVPIWERY